MGHTTIGGDPFGQRGKPDDKVRHTVTLRLRVPSLGAERIARVKGSLELGYYGGYEIAKVENAVPKDGIQSAGRSARPRRFDSSERGVKSPDLDRLGIGMQVMHGMSSNGMTSLSVNLEEKGSSVSAYAQMIPTV